MNSWIERIAFQKKVLGFTLDKTGNLYICSDSLYISNNMGKSYSSYKLNININVPTYYYSSNILYQNDTFALVVSHTSDSIYSDIYYSIDNCVNFIRTIRFSDTVNAINGGRNSIYTSIFDKHHNYYFYNIDLGIYKIQNISKPEYSHAYSIPYSSYWTDFKMIGDSILVFLWDGILKYSKDEGETWHDFENQPAYFYTIGTNQNTLLAVDLDRCWKTTDLGKTWEVICSGLLYSSYIASPLIADNGTVFICRPYHNISVLKGTLITGAEEEPKTSENVYYSEFTNLINIKTETEIESIQLFDLMGNQINNLKIFGNVIDATYLSSGTYFYRIKTLARTLTGVVIVNK
jgi:hypothetical protein